MNEQNPGRAIDGGSRSMIQPLDESQVERWGRDLAQEVESIVRQHPGVDPENVRHTLLLLELPPLERLQRSLLRGRAAAQRK